MQVSDSATPSSQRVARQTELSEEEKKKIAAMQRPSEMPYEDPCNNHTYMCLGNLVL